MPITPIATLTVFTARTLELLPEIKGELDDDLIQVEYRTRVVQVVFKRPYV